VVASGTYTINEVNVQNAVEAIASYTPLSGRARGVGI